jgi:hypothetical protein
MRHLEIMHEPGGLWQVRYEDDPTPLSRHVTLAEPVAEATAHARQFGINVIHVYELDDEQRIIALEPDYPAPTPRDVKGPTAD